MDIRFDGQQTFVRPLINEQQVSVSRVFTALREKQRPEQPVEGKELLAFENFKQVAKSNAATVKETQTALQASYEIQDNAQYVLRLITELQDLARQSINPTLEPEDMVRLQGRSLQIKQELHSSQQLSQQELRQVLEKYNPDLLSSASNSFPLSETRHLPTALEQFAFDPAEIESLSLAPGQQPKALAALEQLGERTEGLLGYMDALQGRMHATLRMKTESADRPAGRIATVSRAREAARDVSQQIREKAGVALSSQSNMAYTDVMTLLDI